MIKEMTLKYLTLCIKRKKKVMIAECNRVKQKLGLSELETAYPKSKHSLVATSEFVFITGGSYNNEDRSFEILVLSNNSLYRGPDLNHTRESHASFIVDNYLYVMFGTVLSTYWTTMSYERIEIPQVGLKDKLSHFYREKKWEYAKLSTDFSMHDFKVFNCFRTYDSQIYCFGQFGTGNDAERCTIRVRRRVGDGEFEVKEYKPTEEDKEGDNALRAVSRRSYGLIWYFLEFQRIR